MQLSIRPFPPFGCIVIIKYPGTDVAKYINNDTNNATFVVLKKLTMKYENEMSADDKVTYVTNNTMGEENLKAYIPDSTIETTVTVAKRRCVLYQ